MKRIHKYLSVLLAVLIACSFAAMAFAADTDACEHSYYTTQVAPTCAEKGYTLHTCTKCGDFYKDSYIDPIGHNYGDWTNEKEATCTEEGLDVRTCRTCSGKETKTIPVKDHEDKNSDGKCDTCGKKMQVKIAPFDWLKALFKAIREWFAFIFA